MFRVLSIDGGGIKGIFPAAFLCALQESLERPIAEYFDLIAGTSTGGIIALGLGLGLTPDEILNFYRSNGSKIFPGAQNWITRTQHYFFTKYRPDPLEIALKSAFGDRLLGHSRKRLVIPSFSARSGKIYVYKTPHHEHFESDWKRSAVEVGMATAAAPSYFPPYIGSAYIAHLDGGMWANNPTGNAVAEAIGVLGASPESIRVLSIGCTSVSQTFTLGTAGLWGWRRKALEAAFSGQSFGSMGIAALLVGHSRIRRIDPVVAAGRFSLDDVSSIDDLEGLAREYAREELPGFKVMFDRGPADRFLPFYGPLISEFQPEVR
ncbi:MAG TPA: CBASS cGAMP-activated phospholipase [Terracidiphilus sp.]|nr:CBASS cGAMP-activated phospholipase [Terracidiphilus sp.]